MSLKSSPIPPIPEVTACVARAAFPHGNVVMQLRDALGTIYTDEVFADLFPTHGQPAEAPWRLALVTIFQFLEGLTDRQAAEAVRDRLAWKYALSLELTDVGFDHTVLSEFRSRLVKGGAEQRLLDLLLERCRQGGWLNVFVNYIGAHVQLVWCLDQVLRRTRERSSSKRARPYICLFRNFRRVMCPST